MGNFECSECGAAFDSAEELANHIKDSHADEGKENSFECKKCGERFESAEELREHMEEESSESE